MSTHRDHLTQLASWKALTDHYLTVRNCQLNTLFKEDPLRFQRFSQEDCGLLLD